MKTVRAICAAIAISIVTSCGALSSNPAVKPAIDCAIAAVAKDTIDVVPVVIAILEGGGESWVKMLDGLASAVGRDVLACAVLDAEAQLQPANGAAVVEPPNPAVKRAQTYIEQHAMRFR